VGPGRAGVRGRPGAGQRHAGRAGQGLRAGHAVDPAGPVPDPGPGHRVGRTPAADGHRLRQDPGLDGPPDRRLPGHPVADRRLRGRHRVDQVADPVRGLAGAGRHGRPARLVHRQAGRRGHGQQGRRPGHADPRWHGLHQGTDGRALVPRAAAAAHLRGHRRDPAAHHRPQPAQGSRPAGRHRGVSEPPGGPADTATDTATAAAGVRALFSPRAIALVGATDKSGWSVNTHLNLRVHEFGGPVYLVNPRTEVVHGERAHRSLSELPGPVDLAYVMVPTAAVLDVLTEGADAGIRAFVILTAGFGETGPEGARREAEIMALARQRGLTVLGPNGNGYINAAAGITPYGLPIPVPLLRGPVGVVLQSGGLASAVLSLAQARNLGISLLVSMGNESMLSVTDVVEHLVDDPATRVIAVFLESIRQPAEFAAAARRARAAGKPIVALKVGRSDTAQHTAQAHTGALTGDDAVIDSVFRRLGVIRVRSLEDLIITSGVLAELTRDGVTAAGPLAGNRLGVVTPSGGASEIIADRAEDEGLALPPFAPATTAALKAMLPAFADVANPLDVTGYVVVGRTLLGRAREIVVTAPGLDVVLLLADPVRDEPADPALPRAVLAANAGRIAVAPK